MLKLLETGFLEQQPCYTKWEENCGLDWESNFREEKQFPIIGSEKPNVQNLQKC